MLSKLVDADGTNTELKSNDVVTSSANDGSEVTLSIERRQVSMRVKRVPDTVKGYGRIGFCDI